MENAHPRRLAEDLEGFGQICNGLLVVHPGPGPCNPFVIHVNYLTDIF